MSTQQKKSLAFGAVLLGAFLALVAYSWMGRDGRDALQGDRQVGVQTAHAPSGDEVKQGEVVDGNFGYVKNEAETEAFLKTLENPLLRQAGPDLFRNDEKRDTMLYRAYYRAFERKLGRPWVVGRQGIGDCVSWGWAHGIDIASAIRYCNGEDQDWLPASTESIYGGSRVEARGGHPAGYRDGSYGAAAAKFVNQWGVLHRKQYDGVDLTNYSAARARDWGNFGNGGQNDNGKLDEEAKKSPVQRVALVTNFEEAAAAIQSGYPVPVCSGYGFSSRRDEDGFSARQGSWSHCMCFVAVRYGDRPGLLCLNSWGPTYFSGPKWPADQPDGSFWVDKRHVDGMLAGRDSFAVSGHDGFPLQELDHEGWVIRAPGKAIDEAPEPIFALAL